LIPTTEDLLPWVKERGQPVLDRMKAERDKEISDYLDTIADDENDLKELRKKKLKEQLEYIKQKGKYDDLLARFKAADKTKTLIIPADVSAWSRWYFDTKAPDNDNELTKWARKKLKRHGQQVLCGIHRLCNCSESMEYGILPVLTLVISPVVLELT
jgi:hypothetical protein